MLCLRREEEILNLQNHDSDLTKGRLEAVSKEAKTGGASGFIHVVRKTAGKEESPVKYRNNCSQKNQKVWEAEWGAFPRREPIPLKRRGLRKTLDSRNHEK